MNPYTKAVLFVIRLAAGGIILTSVIYLLSYTFFAVGKQTSEGNGFWIGLNVVLIVLGLALLLKSRRLAQTLTQDFEE